MHEGLWRMGGVPGRGFSSATCVSSKSSATAWSTIICRTCIASLSRSERIGIAYESNEAGVVSASSWQSFQDADTEQDMRQLRSASCSNLLGAAETRLFDVITLLNRCGGQSSNSNSNPSSPRTPLLAPYRPNPLLLPRSVSLFFLIPSIHLSVSFPSLLRRLWSLHSFARHVAPADKQPPRLRSSPAGLPR